MVRPAKNIVDVNMQILRIAGEPISNQQMMKHAERIYGDDWNTSKRINLQCMRTALHSLGIISHPRRGIWGLTKHADARFARLKDFDVQDVWNEHMRIKHGK